MMKKSRWLLPVTTLLVPLWPLWNGGCGPEADSFGEASTTAALGTPGGELDKLGTRPVLSAINPPTASNRGGAAVTITGRNFVAGATVKIAGALATSSVLSSTTISATLPARPGICGHVPVHLENPSGQSVARSDLFTLHGEFGYLDPVSYAVNRYASQVAVADFNRDGNLDLVVGTLDGGNVSFLAGRGDGTFRTALNVAAGGLPDSVIVADFNKDGNPDIAVSDSNTTGTGHILLGKGRSFFGSPFAPPIDFTALEYIDGIRSADINSDGKADLVTFGDNSLSVLLGKGDGTFLPRIDIARTTRPWSLAIGDLNRDGHPDLAVANYADNTVSVLLGKGDGTFSAGGTYATDKGPIFIEMKDLNEDGKLDLVSGNAKTVSVLLGKGDGTVAASQNYLATAHSVNDLAVRDLNDDGHLDLALVDEIGNAVSILIGKGDGSFAAPVSSPTGAVPNWLGVGDFDGDHRLDLITTNVDDPGSVSVLLRECM